MTFTTRPEIQGTFGVVSSTHWLASQAGMRMLEQGGNAFDAAAAAGFVLQVVEPHLNGPGGDMTLQFFDANKKKSRVLCGQGYAPEAATIEHYKNVGLEIIPQNGVLATVVPGSMGAWFALCRDYGKLYLRDILEPAISYAQDGFPLLPRVAETINHMAPQFKEYWPTSYEQWVPGEKPPPANQLFKLPRLAQTYIELKRFAEEIGDRTKQFERAHEAFYQGFVAERIENFLALNAVMDLSGQENKGVLTANDMANFKPVYETPVSKKYHDWTVQKAGPWSQGPVLLQCLGLLEETDFSAFRHDSADFMHVIIEAMKLAFADREIYYGDPNHVNVPIQTLLSAEYTANRRLLLKRFARSELQPGEIAGFEDQKKATEALIEQYGTTEQAIYEPTMEHLAEPRGDTVHVDVIDRWGNRVAATPSGGWLQHSPTIPDLGFCLNTRAQMFSLTPGLANSLEPFKRPRTTLSPTLAYNHKDGRALALGTPGGDQQDQWQLSVLLRIIHYNLNLQEAIDAPLFHSNHFPSSFYPRRRQNKHVVIDGCVTEREFMLLKAKGHIVERAGNRQLGRLTATMRDKNGMLYAAATANEMQAYAVGR